jgi:hypothetical protein
MPTYSRPSLLDADLIEVSQHLLSKGITSSCGKDATAMLIVMDGTSGQLDTAMADFPNVGSWTPPPTPLDIFSASLNPDGTVPPPLVEDAVEIIVPEIVQTIEGPPGPQGIQGIKGDTGDTGANGVPGIQGPPGTNGTNGAQGIQGIQGPAGSQGIQGVPGPAGVPVYANLAGATALALAINDVVKVTPTATATLTSTVPAAGHQRAVILVQSNTTAKTMTFGTGFKPVGTLALGTTANRVFVVSFVSDGTFLYERSRTAAMVA